MAGSARVSPKRRVFGRVAGLWGGARGREPPTGVRTEVSRRSSRDDWAHEYQAGSLDGCCSRATLWSPRSLRRRQRHERQAWRETAVRKHDIAATSPQLLGGDEVGDGEGSVGLSIGLADGSRRRVDQGCGRSLDPFGPLGRILTEDGRGPEGLDVSLLAVGLSLGLDVLDDRSNAFAVLAGIEVLPAWKWLECELLELGVGVGPVLLASKARVVL